MHKYVLDQPHRVSGVFPTSPMLLITSDLGVIFYFLFLPFLGHQLHMVVVCINLYAVHIRVCNLSSLISAQSQHKGMFRLPSPPIPSIPRGYREQDLYHNHVAQGCRRTRHMHTNYSDLRNKIIVTEWLYLK